MYYRRLSEAHNRLVERLTDYASLIFGEKAVFVAIDEFLLWPDPEAEISQAILDRTMPLFLPWYLFNWEYDSIDAGVELKGPEGRTVAELYAEEHGDRLDVLEKRLIENVNRKPYSFLEVLSVDKGKGMTLKDVLKGTRIEIREHTGSEYVQPGDGIFGRAIMVDGVGMLIGLSPTLIPPAFKPEIIQLRKQLRGGQSAITDDTLYDWDTEIRELYFDIDHVLNTMPQMQNTDGDPMELHRLIYEIRSADEAFEKLCDLCVTRTPEELRADAKRDNAGRIVRVEFPWDRLEHKKMSGMPDTVLGRIVLDGRRLIAEINSAERAKALRRKIDSRLGDVGRFKVDDIQDMDSLINEHTPGTNEKTVSEQEVLMQHPEVQEQVAEMMRRHWESWVDQKIPALEGISPRDAVKTADGREAVEALLKDAETQQGEDFFTAEVNRKGAQRAREILELDLNGS